MEQFLQVGIITTTHGIGGEVKVYPTTDDVMRFKKLKEVYLDTGKTRMLVHVDQVKFFKNMVILRFKEFHDINLVQGFRSCPLLVDRAHAVPLGENENFIADLIGLSVYEEDKKLGTLMDVLQTGANDVYVVKMEDGKELLIPAIRQCILNVDLEQERVDVHLLEGLLDL